MDGTAPKYRGACTSKSSQHEVGMTTSDRPSRVQARGNAARFFPRFGPSVDTRLERLECDAAALLEQVRQGERKRAPIKAWVKRQVEVCATVFAEPPPPSLVELVATLMGVKERSRADRRNREMFFAAATYLANNPNATATQIKRAIKYDQQQQIKKWMADPEFMAAVNARRPVG